MKGGLVHETNPGTSTVSGNPNMLYHYEEGDLLSYPTTPANPEIRNQSLLGITDLFDKSVYSSRTEMSFLKYFLDLLSEHTVPEEEARFHDIFLDGVRHCNELHSNKQIYRRCAENLSLCIQKIVEWINSTLPDDQKFHVQIFVRQKAITMHLMKVLKKSLKCDYLERIEDTCIDELSSCIHDFLGILVVILDKYDTSIYDSHPQLKHLYKMIRDIISGQNSDAKQAFLSWLMLHEPDNSVKTVVELTLNTPFKTSRFKNYVKKPQPSGYRSYQWTSVQLPYSQDIPGSEYEFQVRDWYMHIHAMRTHRDYKDLDKPEFGGIDPKILANVFYIKDFTRVDMVGFSEYNPNNRPINPEDVYLGDLKEVTHIGDAFGFAVPLVIKSQSI